MIHAGENISKIERFLDRNKSIMLYKRTKRKKTLCGDMYIQWCDDDYDNIYSDEDEDVMIFDEFA